MLNIARQRARTQTVLRALLAKIRVVLDGKVVDTHAGANKMHRIPHTEGECRPGCALAVGNDPGHGCGQGPRPVARLYNGNLPAPC